MSYVALNDKAAEYTLEYPPVPDAYTDPCSYSNANAGHQTRASDDATSPPSSFSPPYGHQLMASSTAPPRHPSYPDTGLNVTILRKIAPGPPPAPSSEQNFSPYSVGMDHTISSADATTTRFLSFSAEAHYKKRPRGTTGSIICDECGSKFTRLASLNRHKTTSHGEKSTRKPISTQRKTRKTKVGEMASDHSTHASSTMTAMPIPLHNPDQPMRLVPEVNTIYARSEVVNPANVANPSVSANLPTHKLKNSTQAYVPRGPDTDVDRQSYYCDICPGMFARRDILQQHKARSHGLTEIPYLPDWGAIDAPSYLTGVTHENGSSHSRTALRIFEGGALSSSPCQSCIAKGLECIVNPFGSSKCCYCSYRDDGRYCGAAGVKLVYVSIATLGSLSSC